MTKGRIVATVVIDLCYPYDMPVKKAKTFIKDMKAKLTNGFSLKHETVNVYVQYADLYHVPTEDE